MSLADPSEVHPKHDQPTPENIDDWSEDQLERFNELTDAKLTTDARRERAERLDDDSAEAAQELLGAVTGEGAEQTATVDIADGVLDEPMEAEVLTYRPGKVEKRLARIETVDDAVDALVFAITEMVVAPERFTNPEVWHHVYDEGGVKVLEAYLENIMGPAESVDSFRTE